MTEIEKLLELNYEECCEYLIKKYGPVPGDYFLNKECTRKNPKITRAKSDGLYIHHIDEDKAIMLSSTDWAKKNPFEYQKADRLVYCNLLEHLVLHIKIFEFPNKNKNLNEEVGTGGICNFIVPTLNDIYSGIPLKSAWRQKVAKVILPMKDDYFKCIKRLVDKNFPYSLLTAYEYKAKDGSEWKKENNAKIFKELIAIGVKW